MVSAIPRCLFNRLYGQFHSEHKILHCFVIALMRDSPRIPGHEVIGHIVAIGPHEKHWKVGDRVGGPWHGGHDG